MDEPLVTIVMGQRERFAYCEKSLESVYKNTSLPFKLIYIDSASPPHIKNYLETQAAQKGFRLVRIDHFITPNQWHNLGQGQVDTKYVVFIDNEVSTTPGWLEKLVQCAEETDAWVVGPLYLEGKIEDQIVHTAGAQAHFMMEQGRRIFYGPLRFAKRKLSEVQDDLRRETVECVEFHCMLVRNEVFGITGPLDEKFMGISDQHDFCLAVHAAGGSIYLEPEAIVAFPHVYAPLAWMDLPLVFEHWSDVRSLKNVNHLCEKWGLHEDDIFIRLMSKFAKKQRRYLIRLWFPWQRYKFSRIIFFPLGFLIEKFLSRLFRSTINRFEYSDSAVSLENQNAIKRVTLES